MPDSFCQIRYFSQLVLLSRMICGQSCGSTMQLYINQSACLRRHNLQSVSIKRPLGSGMLSCYDALPATCRQLHSTNISLSSAGTCIALTFLAVKVMYLNDLTSNQPYPCSFRVTCD